MTTRLLLKAVKSDGQSKYTWGVRRAWGRYNIRKFMWPLTPGAVVVPDRWSSTHDCGDGLHGFALQEGKVSWSLATYFPRDKWVVFIGHDAVKVDVGKWKCARAEVLFAGTLPDALQFMERRRGRRFDPAVFDKLVNFLNQAQPTWQAKREERQRVLDHCRHLCAEVQQRFIVERSVAS